MSSSLVSYVLLVVLCASISGASPSPTNPLSIPITQYKRAINDPSWIISAGASLKNKYSPSSLDRKRNIGANELINQNQDTSYFGTIAVGTPAKSFNVILDTGSADLFLAGSQCFNGCSGVPNFDATQSSSFRNLTTSFSIRYGTGQAAGNLASDVIQMAGFGISGQTFAVVNQISTNLLRSPVSGLMGLAFSTLSTARATPFWQSLVKAGSWDQPLMAFYLTRFRRVNGAAKLEVGGSFDMGFTNSSLYTGEISYTSIPSGDETFWQIPLTTITVQGSPISFSEEVLAAIDTGTTLIGGPADVIAKLYALIPGAQRALGDYQGYWSFPCSTAVEISFAFGNGPAWSIKPSDFILTQLSTSTCIGGFFELSTSGTSAPKWIIGDTFLKNVYSVFRYSPAAVGFAALSTTALNEADVRAALPTPSVGSGNIISGNAASPLPRTSIFLITLALFIGFLNALP